jgi:hypothetical protein
MALLDSRLPKDSNGTKFANFGCRDQKIWILEDWAKFWFGTSIWKSVRTQAGHGARFD